MSSSYFACAYAAALAWSFLSGVPFCDDLLSDTTIKANAADPTISEGDYIRMGNYNGEDVDWFCYKINSTGIMMLSKYALKTSSFGSNSTYTQSNIYKWLDGDNTEAGAATFNAKNEAENSTVQYTINNGSADVSDGGTAMTFTEGGTQTLTFTKTSEPTYAGKHSEKLTFGISVQDTATTAPSLASVFENNSTITVNVPRGHRIAGTVYGTGGYDFEYKDGVFTATNMPNVVKPVCAVAKLDDTHFVVKYSTDSEFSIKSIENQGVDGLDIYTFDTTTNTYTYHPATWGSSSNYYTQINTISVNGVDIPVTQA